MSVTHAAPAERPTLGPADQPKLDMLRARLRELAVDPGMVLEALYAAQELFTYVPPEAISMIAEELSVPESEVFGVVTFYTMFYLEPQPTYILRVCRDLSCHLAGAPGVIAAFHEQLGVRRDELTTDGRFKIEVVSCLGLCEKQPAMLVNLEQHGPLSPQSVPQLLQGLRDRGD